MAMWSKRLFPILSAAVGAVFIFLGVFEFGFWDAVKGPLGGFYPTLVGGVLIVASILALMQSLKEQAPRYFKEEFWPALGALGVMLGSFVIGMFPSLFLFLLFWMKVVERSSWMRAVRVTAIIGIAAYLIFGLWLAIPFPKGLLFQWL